MDRTTWLRYAAGQLLVIYEDIEKLQVQQQYMDMSERQAAIALAKTYIQAIEFLQFAIKAVNSQNLVSEMVQKN